MAGDNHVVTITGRRDGAETAYVKVGEHRFVVGEPTYDVPKVVADQLKADRSIIVEVGTETKAERDARLKADDAAQLAAEERRAAKRAAAKPEEEAPAEGESETDEGQEG